MDRNSPRTDALEMATNIAAPWKPTHRHRNGGLYRFLGNAWIEKSMTRAVVYDDSNGDIWVRPVKEFFDGRFKGIETATE